MYMFNFLHITILEAIQTIHVAQKKSFIVRKELAVKESQ